ncbi:MAG TPA: citrate/2-methylcitrate synthase, partial [Candidatus Manganitrophaceae bacterium]
MTEKVFPGLEGVLAGESAICDVDPDSGGLLYRGYRIEDLAEGAAFEEVAYLLLIGRLPNRIALSEFSERLRQSRPLSENMTAFLSKIPATANPMDVLRTAVSLLGLEDPDSECNDHQANLKKAIRLIAQIPSALAAWRRFPEKPVSDPA